MTPSPQIWQGDGWRVEVLFSRAGLATGILVSLDTGSDLLLDCGDGTTRDLVLRELELDRSYPFLQNLDTILITHGHFDHVGGLHTLLGFLRMIARNTPLIILAPHGAREDKLIIDAFKTGYPDSVPFEIERREVKSGEKVEIGEVIVNPFDVVHCGSTKKGGIGKPMPALGYILEYRGQRVVYTGDCGLDSNLAPYVDNADLLLIEATLREPGGEIEHRVHLSLDSARKFARLAKHAFIIHRA